MKNLKSFIRSLLHLNPKPTPIPEKKEMVVKNDNPSVTLTVFAPTTLFEKVEKQLEDLQYESSRFDLGDIKLVPYIHGLGLLPDIRLTERTRFSPKMKHQEEVLMDYLDVNTSEFFKAVSGKALRVYVVKTALLKCERSKIAQSNNAQGHTYVFYGVEFKDLKKFEAFFNKKYEANLLLTLPQSPSDTPNFSFGESLFEGAFPGDPEAYHIFHVTEYLDPSDRTYDFYSLEDAFEFIECKLKEAL